MDELVDRVALVTGAGRGIGREVALALASLGAGMAVNDINPLNLDETVELITSAGGIARPYVFDVAKRMPIEGMVSQVLADFGRIDILVNHAAVRPDASLLEMDEWEFHRTLDVNLGGVFFCMQQVGRVMREQGAGTIVNLIDIADAHFHRGHAAHSASQVALVGLTQTAAAELSAYRIRVNALICGSNPANLLVSQVDNSLLQAWCDAHPKLYMGDHPNLVSKAAYLCAPASNVLNGLIITAEDDT